MASARRDWVLYGCLTFCFAFGFAVYTGIFQNFARETLGLDPRQYGVLESLREVPGLLTAFTAGTLVALAEPRLAGFALAFCAVGIAATGTAGSYWSLVAITAAWSIGFHLYSSVAPAIVMALSDGKEGGKRLGQMGGVSSAAGLLALGFTRIAKMHVSYTLLFQLAGLLILAGAILAFVLSSHAAGGQRTRIVFRREYKLYYLLTFLEGCRRQIFGTFASFALILVYHTSVETMLTLAFVNAAAAVVAAPMVGRLIDVVGERRVMTVYYATLVLVFSGYASLRAVHGLYALYLVDNLLFACSLGVTTFLNRIVRPGDLTPSLAMGTTMNHVAAVLVPVTGGALWYATGSYRLPFWIGVGIVLVSLVAAQRLPGAIGSETTTDSHAVLVEGRAAES